MLAIRQSTDYQTNKNILKAEIRQTSDKTKTITQRCQNISIYLNDRKPTEKWCAACSQSEKTERRPIKNDQAYGFILQRATRQETKTEILQIPKKSKSLYRNKKLNRSQTSVGKRPITDRNAIRISH